MTEMSLILMAALLIKHFVCDYPLQKGYMLEEKGFYLWRGGIHHAVIHGVGTACALVLVGLPHMAAPLGLLDTLIHYHVDWLKVQYNRRQNINPSDQKFWNALGVDQLAHQLTYVLLAWLALAK